MKANSYIEQLEKELPYQKIAVVGGLRSGKSTVRDILVREFGFEAVSFGAMLKEIYADTFRHVRDVEVKDVEALVAFGQACRAIDEDVWVSHVNNLLETREWELVNGYKSFSGIVIDDLRQPNEYQWAKDNGFKIIRINTDEDIRFDRAVKAGDKISKEDLYRDTESHYMNFEVDYEMRNEGSLKDFEQKVIDLFKYEFNEQLKEVKKVKRDIVANVMKVLPLLKAEAISGNHTSMEYLGAISHSLSTLSEQEHEVVVKLILNDGLRNEVADSLGISEWAVSKLRNSALEKLYDELIEGNEEMWYIM